MTRAQMIAFTGETELVDEDFDALTDQELFELDADGKLPPWLQDAN